jgi:hypothetical protein
MSYVPAILSKRKSEINLNNWIKYDTDRPKKSNQYRCLYYDVNIEFFRISFRYFEKSSQTWYYYNDPTGQQPMSDDPAYWQLEESDVW